MKSPRQTSIDCYHQIKAEGLLSKLRFRTYHAMLACAPCTAGELQESIDQRQIKVKHAWKLLSQLRDLGVVYELGTRPCTVTGRNVIVWDLTDMLPVGVTQKESAKKIRTECAVKAFRELFSNRDHASYHDWKDVANLIREI